MVGMRIVLLLLLALVMAPAAISSSTQARARVSIVDESPLVVRGTGFKAGERVTVSVSHAKTLFRRVAFAGSSGVLVARWTRAMPTTCGSTTITAFGSRGTRAVFKTVANECAPPGPVDPIGAVDPPSSNGPVAPPADPTGPVDPPLYPSDPQPKH